MSKEKLTYRFSNDFELTATGLLIEKSLGELSQDQINYLNSISGIQDFQNYKDYGRRFYMELPVSAVNEEQLITYLGNQFEKKPNDQLRYKVKFINEKDPSKVHWSTKSFLVKFSSEESLKNIVQLTTSLKSIEEIIPGVWKLDYKSEKDACNDFNVFKDLSHKANSSIQYVEPNFSNFTEKLIYGSRFLINQPPFLIKENPKIFANLFNDEVFDQIKYPNSGSKNSNYPVKVAILDTEVDQNHPCFVYSNITHKSFIESEVALSREDKGSHGTSCASIICGSQLQALDNFEFRGLLNQVELLSIQVVLETDDQYVESSFSALVKGLYFASFHEEVDVISCSLDTSYLNDSDILKDLIENIVVIGVGEHNKTIPIVFAAGNNRKYTQFPACLENVISVGSVNRNGEFMSIDNTRAIWSSASGKIDICAPGHMITARTRNTKPRSIVGEFRSLEYHNFMGTSCSTPIISSAIASLKSTRSGKQMSAKDIISKIHNSAYLPDEIDWEKSEWGPGIIDFEKFLTIT